MDLQGFFVLQCLETTRLCIVIDIVLGVDLFIIWLLAGRLAKCSAWRC